jgi:hypothetical protein
MEESEGGRDAIRVWVGQSGFESAIHFYLIFWLWKSGIWESDEFWSCS